MANFLIHNHTHPAQPVQARQCSSFLCRLLGLMFRARIGEFEGLWFAQPTADRINASIHMLFMRFDIAAIWVDADLRVVDKVLARRWRPAYFPAHAAKYILETHPDRFTDFNVGDLLVLESC